MVQAALAGVIITLSLTTISCKETPRTWNNKAVKALEARQYEEAIRCYNKTLDLDPNNLTALYYLGRLYQQEGRVDSAISAFRRIIALDPERRGLYNHLGELYRAQGEVDEALRAFKKALDRDGDFEAAHYNIGMAYRELGKNTAAAQHLYEAGNLAFIHGDNATALKAYRALKEIGPERIVHELHQLLQPLLEEEPAG